MEEQANEHESTNKPGPERPSREVQARGAVIHLLRDALEGKVKLEEIDGRWPFEDGRFDEVLEDLHHGVGHTPGRLFSRRVDFRAWESMWEHWQIYMDLKLFEAGLPDSDILRLRDQIDVLHLDGLYEVDLFLQQHLELTPGGS